MSMDRVVSVISLLIGIGSVGVSIYLAKPDSNVTAVSLSGWLVSAVIALSLSITAFRAIGALQRELIQAKNDAIKYKDDMLAERNDLVTYRNISNSLSSMINPEPMRETIRNKLAAHLGNKPDTREE